MGRDHLQDLNMDGRKKLKMDLKEECGLDSSGSGQGKVVGSCDHFQLLSNYQVPNKHTSLV
jgi:hypothetical protein